MKILGLDGALGAFSAAFVDTDAPAEARTASAQGADALERGLYAVENVLAGTPFGNIDRIAVSVGPGSFTGLRIALSYAKSLASAIKRPLVGISSYDALEPTAAPYPLLVAIRGRSGAACVRLRLSEEAAAQTFGGTFADIAAFAAERLPHMLLSCAGDAAGVKQHLGERGFIVQSYPPASEPAALAVARIAARRDPAPSAHAVTAEYGEQPRTTSP